MTATPDYENVNWCSAKVLGEAKHNLRISFSVFWNPCVKHWQKDNNNSFQLIILVLVSHGYYNITDYHKLYSLKQEKCISPQFWRQRFKIKVSALSGGSQGRSFPCHFQLLVADQHSLAYSLSLSILSSLSFLLYLYYFLCLSLIKVFVMEFRNQEDNPG